jgi:4'-phosphopantetheinyl transferase
MPQIKEERIDDQTVLGVWEISENSAMLEGMIQLNEHEKELLSTYHNELRRQHWLSYRILIRKILGRNDVMVHYNDIGKPYLENPSAHISVTHSGRYSAVIYNGKKPVGIDIERLQDRIEKISERFLSEDELRKINPEKRIQHLVTLWAAKEALYKLRGRTDVEFAEQILIEPFVPMQSGEFRGKFIIDDIEKEYLLHYFIIEEYVLVWTKEDL